jgi:hypothetical protein
VVGQHLLGTSQRIMGHVHCSYMYWQQISVCVEESVLQYIKIRTFPHNTLFKNLFAKVILFISAADIRYRVGAMSTM